MYLCDETTNVDSLRISRDGVGKCPSGNFFEHNYRHVDIINTNRMINNSNAKFDTLERCRHRENRM